MQQISLYFPGRPGAYSERAAMKVAARFDADSVSVRCAGPTFVDAWNAVTSEKTLAVLPIQNSTAGWVAATCELLLDDEIRSRKILGTVELPIHHALIGVKGARVDDVTAVWSHPQALAQCKTRVERHGWTTKSRANTAVAAEEVAQLADPTVACIADPACAVPLGLVVLDTRIQDRADNATTFVVVGHSSAIVAEPTMPIFRFLGPLSVEVRAICAAHALGEDAVAAIASGHLVIAPTRDIGHHLLSIPSTKKSSPIAIGDYSPFDAAKASALS